MSTENLKNIVNFEGWGLSQGAWKISVISMKFCTGIINVKKEYESAIVPWWVGFPGKLFHFYPFKYWPHQFFWILYHYRNKKTLFNCNYVVFEMDISSFPSAWQFFNTNSLPNFLRSPRVFLKSRTLISLIFLLKSTTLGRKWFFSHLIKQLF